MAKVLQVIDVDSSGHCVRLDDGRVILTPHGGDHPQVGQEFTEAEDVNDTLNVIIQQREQIIQLEAQLAVLKLSADEPIQYTAPFRSANMDGELGRG